MVSVSELLDVDLIRAAWEYDMFGGVVRHLRRAMTEAYAGRVR